LKILKPALIPSMLELMRAGANRAAIPLSTTELAKKLGQSQQAASHHLMELERAGLIERRRTGLRLSVRITRDGMGALESLYSQLKNEIEGTKSKYVFHGKLFQGLGEGGYYIGLEGYKNQFSKLLGFEPFPGTLNLKLESSEDVEQKRQLRFREGLRVEGFADGTRTYGGATCYRAFVSEKEPAAVLVIDRTHYDDTVLELISPVHLRKELRMKDGDEVLVEVSL
jgi:riboflavin kinase